MQFSTTFLAATAAVLSTVSAQGILSINATAIINPSQGTTDMTLQVLNGNVGDPATCAGTTTGSLLPTSGNIYCEPGYSLSYTWASEDEGIAATYGTPSSAPFTYNVPLVGPCEDQSSATDPTTTCTFGFQDLFSKKVRRSFRS